MDLSSVLKLIPEAEECTNIIAEMFRKLRLVLALCSINKNSKNY